MHFCSLCIISGTKQHHFCEHHFLLQRSFLRVNLICLSAEGQSIVCRSCKDIALISHVSPAALTHLSPALLPVSFEDQSSDLRDAPPVSQGLFLLSGHPHIRFSYMVRKSIPAWLVPGKDLYLQPGEDRFGPPGAGAVLAAASCPGHMRPTWLAPS